MPPWMRLFLLATLWPRSAAFDWTSHEISTTASLAVSVLAADIDGDGDADAVYGSGGSSVIAWYENDGVGGSWILHEISTAYTPRRPSLQHSKT